MKALAFLFILLASPLIAGQDDANYPTTQDMKDATARDDYPRLKVGDHVLHLSPETIISDLNFLFRVYGGRQEALAKKGDKATEFLKQDYQQAYNHLLTVISNFERSLAEGTLKGWTYHALVERAVRGHIRAKGTDEEERKWYVAARFFLHRWLRVNPDELRPAFERRIREVRENLRPQRKKLTPLVIEIAEPTQAYVNALQIAVQQVIEIETQAQELARLPDTREQIVQLYRQLVKVLKDIGDQRDALKRRALALEAQILAFNQEILFQDDLYRFMREFLAEYGLWEQHAWVGLGEDLIAMPEQVLTALNQNLPEANRQLWEPLLAQPRVEPTLARTPVTTTVPVQRQPAVQPQMEGPPVGRVTGRRQIQQPVILDQPRVVLGTQGVRSPPQNRQAINSNSPGILGTIFGFSASPK